MEKRVVCMLFSFLLFITSCEEKEDKNNLLADSDWRLVSMENNKTNEVTTPQREGNEYYFLSFGRSHMFTGFGAVNEFSGTYQVFSNQSSLSITVLHQTNTGDTVYGDDQSFINRVKEADGFIFSTSTLTLQGDNYTLHFKRVYPENV